MLAGGSTHTRGLLQLGAKLVQSTVAAGDSELYAAAAAAAAAAVAGLWNGGWGS